MRGSFCGSPFRPAPASGLPQIRAQKAARSGPKFGVTRSGFSDSLYRRMNRFSEILPWLAHLFNPPPLESMTLTQKVGRVFLVALTLVVICILSAMLGALGIFLAQKAHGMLASTPELLDDLAIIFASMIVNTICVIVLLEIRKADRKLIPPPETKPEGDRK
jgi:hypothetical protein